MSNGFDWQRFAPKNRFATLATGGIIVVFAGLLLPQLFLNRPAMAPTPDSPTINEGPTLTAMLLRLLFGLMTTCGLIVATVALLKRRQTAKPATTKTTAPAQPIEVLGMLPVGRGLVYHVRIGENHLLASTDAFGFKQLLPLPPAPVPEADIVPHVISERVLARL